jgi:hypothetical protein
MEKILIKLEEVSPEEVAYLKKQLRTNGVTVTSPNEASNNFYMNGHGVIATGVYQEPEQLLEITITQKPFYLPEEALEQQFAKYIQELYPENKVEEVPNEELV